MGTRSWSALALALLVCGCGDEDVVEPQPTIEPTPCVAGEYLVDDVCLPAGLPPDMRCAPGEWEQDDGSCLPAGVPPSHCGEGFVADDRGCEPILPAMPCPPGQIAVLGDSACRELSPCGAAPWGDIPVDSTTQYVDASYAGMDSDGSELKPWTTIQAGVDAAVGGAIVALAAGSYTGDVRIDRPYTTVWGRCASMVELVGTGVAQAAVLVGPTGSDARLAGMSISGAEIGLIALASNTVVEHVRIHDTGSRGVVVQDNFAEASLTLSGCLVENTRAAAVFGAGVEVVIEDSAIRDIALDGGVYGYGVDMELDTSFDRRSTLSMRRSLVERCHDVGVYALSSDMTVSDSVVRAVEPNAADNFGSGVVAGVFAGRLAPSTLTLERSLVEGNAATGVFIDSSHAVIEDTVVRDNVPPNDAIQSGDGIAVTTMSAPSEVATLELRRSLIDRNQRTGVFIASAEAVVEGVAIRETHAGDPSVCVLVQPDWANPTASSLVLRDALLERCRQGGLLGIGSDLVVEHSLVRGSAAPTDEGGKGIVAETDSTLTLRRSLVSDSHTAGLVLLASAATVEAVEVRDTRETAGVLGGRGIHLESGRERAPVHASLRGVRVANSNALGMLVLNGSATLDGCVFKGTAESSEGLLGDGVAVMSDTLPASIVINATRIEDSARAGIASFGAAVELSHARMICQGFDLGVQSVREFQPEVVDAGDNLCGCPAADASCKAESADLQPPAALP